MVKFYQLAMGSRFTHGGRRMVKVGTGCAEDEHHQAHTVPGIVSVVPDADAVLLSPEAAAKERPDYGPWQEHMEREYGEHGRWKMGDGRWEMGDGTAQDH